MQAIINIRDYGAVGDGKTDDTAAIQRAINENPYATLYVPSGQFMVSQILIKTGINLLGSTTGSSAFYSINPTGDVFVVDTIASIVVSNIVFTTKTLRTSGAYLIIAPLSGDNTGTKVTNCSFIGSATGINFRAASTWAVTGCIWNDYKTAIFVQNTCNHDSGDSCITNCAFASGIGGISVHQVSSGGLKITANKFLNASYHYLGEYEAGDPTSILVMTGNSLESASEASIAFNTTRNRFGQVNISGNQFTMIGKYGIQTVGSQMSCVYIGGNEITVAPTTLAISIGEGEMYTLGTNSINGQNGNVPAIAIGTAQVYVAPQGIYGFPKKFGGPMTNTTFAVKP